VEQNFDAYTDRLRPHLQNWKLERVALVDRVLLVMALYELTAMPTVPGLRLP